MSAPTVTSVTEASPAARAGLAVGDELLSLNGQEPRDVIDFQQLTDADDLSVLVKRAGGPGRPNAWSASAEGEQVAAVLAEEL